MALTPQQIADKWARNMANAGQAMKDGVNNVTVSPGVAAAAMKVKWLANVQAAADDWERSMRDLDVNDWKKRMVDVGVGRATQAAPGAAPVVAAYQQELAPQLASIRSALAAMPRGDFMTNMQRSMKNAEMMKQFGESRRRAGKRRV